MKKSCPTKFYGTALKLFLYEKMVIIMKIKYQKSIVLIQ